MSIKHASVCARAHVTRESQTTTSMATANRWNGFQCNTIKIEVMHGSDGGVFFCNVVVSIAVLKHYIWPYIARYPSFSLPFFTHPRIILLAFFFFFFVCCLNANYSYIQFALKIGNLRSSVWASYSVYFLRFFFRSHLSVRLESENSQRIQRQCRADFHYRPHSHCHSKMHTFILSRVSFRLVPWCAACSLAFSFILIWSRWRTNRIKREQTISIYLYKTIVSCGFFFVHIITSHGLVVSVNLRAKRQECGGQGGKRRKPPCDWINE